MCHLLNLASNISEKFKSIISKDYEKQFKTNFALVPNVYSSEVNVLYYIDRFDFQGFRLRTFPFGFNLRYFRFLIKKNRKHNVSLIQTEYSDLICQ